MLARLFRRRPKASAWEDAPAATEGEGEGESQVVDAEAAQQEPAPVEATATRPESKRRRKARRRPDAMLVTTLDNGVQDHYLVTDAGISRVEAIPQDVSQAVSFTELDYRIPTAKRLFGSAPHAVFVREFGQPHFRVINASGPLRAVYAAESSRLQDYPMSLASGAMALDLLESSREVDRSAPRVTGFRLGDPDAGSCLLILYAADGQGMLSIPTVVPDSSDITSSIRSFIHTDYCQQLQIDVNTHQPVLFSSSDLLSIASELENYPSEPSILGIPERRFYGGIAALTWGSAVVSVGLCGSLLLTARMVDGATDKVRSDTGRVRSETDRMLTQNLRYFARSSGLDVSRLLDTAEALWRPGGTVAIKADDTVQNFSVRIPVAASLAGERNSAPDGPDAKTLTNLLRWPAPKGVLMTGLATTGESNAFIVQYSLAPSAPAGVRVANR